MEALVISSALASREAWWCVTKLEGEADLSSLGQQVFKRISAYYERDSHADSAAPEIILGKLCSELPAHKEKWETVFKNLPKASPGNVVDYMKVARQEALSLRIVSALSGNKFEEASELMEQWTTIDQLGADGQQEDDLLTVMNGVGAAELVEPLKAGNSFTILPRELGSIIDGLLPGDHILVYAPPETGKSLMAINMAAGLAATGKKVLYIGNEDPTTRMLLRFINRFTGAERQEIMQDPDHWTQVANSKGYKNIFFKELSPGGTADVMRLCDHLKPDVCIVDQVPNLHLTGKAQPSKTELLEKLCYELRMYYKSRGILGISLSQASDKAIGKMVLERQDVYYSNIGVQGQVDVMIGVGMTKEMEGQGLRYLSVCKNKASGSHEGLRVRFETTLSRVRME